MALSLVKTALFALLLAPAQGLSINKRSVDRYTVDAEVVAPEKALEKRALAFPATPIAGWNFKACWIDSVGARTLTGASYINGNTMTIEVCINLCAGGNFIYAGMEYSDECCKFSSHVASDF